MNKKKVITHSSNLKPENTIHSKKYATQLN